MYQHHASSGVYTHGERVRSWQSDPVPTDPSQRTGPNDVFRGALCSTRVLTILESVGSHQNTGIVRVSDAEVKGKLTNAPPDTCFDGAIRLS
jgi:hypothetical protein